MPDYWSVPIAPGVITNLNEEIAKGPNFSWLGNLPDAYWAGKTQRNVQDQRDVFANGLPKDPVTGNIDWNQAGQMLAKVGGAGQIQNVIGLQNFELGREALRQLGNGNNIFGGGPAPPSTAAPPANKVVAPPLGGGASVVPGAPAGNMPVAQPSEAPVAPTASTATPRTVAQRNGVDPQIIASKLRIGLDEPIPLNDPSVRNDLIKAMAEARGGAPAGAPAPAPQPAAPGQPAQGQINEATAAQFERRAMDADRMAAATSFSNPQLSQRLQATAQQLMDQAKIIRGALADNAKLTPEQKNAAASSAPSPLEYEATKKTQQLAIEQGQKTYNGIQAQASQFERDLKPYLDVSRSIINDPKFYSGAGGQYVLDFNRVRAAFGDRQAATLQEALQKVTASSVLGQINTQRDQLMEAGGQSSRIFSQQVDLVTKAAPALSTTVAGNRFLVEVATRMGELSSKVADLARQYKATHGDRLDAGFDQQLATYMKNNPVFTAQERSHPELLGAPTVPPDLAHDKPAIIKWGQGLGLKTGDAIRFPSGQIKGMPPRFPNQGSTVQ